jgi:hypothetical protein
MAVTSNTALRITELDFDGIKNNLKAFLRSQSEFEDYDFEGSGMSVLLDILAYNTHYMGYYLNMVGNEMFMDTAQLRSSILSHAKNINYLPTSRRGAKALIDIKVKPSNTEDNTSTSLTLSKYTKVLGTDIDGINYNFIAVNSNTVLKTGSTFNFSNVEIRQGDVITRQFLMDPTNAKRRFNIPSANVDTDTIEVRVQESTSNTDLTIFYKSNNITGLTSNSNIYFIEEGDDLTYNLYFGDGIIGKSPKNGNIINVTYLDTVGSPANNITKFGVRDKIGTLYRDNVAITTVISSYGGTDKETIEQIRTRAPYAYGTQDRGVTTGDYETLLLRDYPNVLSVSIWGGEDNVPVVYGKVFISIRTKQNYALTNQEKEYIKNDLIRTKNIVTVTPEIVDPEYTYICPVVRVTYNPNLTTNDEGGLIQLVKAAAYNYNSVELSGFSSTFRKSKLQAYIETSDRSITGSSASIYAQKRVVVDLVSPKKYDVNFNMPIQKGTSKDRLYTYPALLINDATNTEREVYFEEILDSPTGINSILVTTTGSGYTSAPVITISGDGTGAAAVATIVNGVLTSIKMSNKGSGYTRATVTLSGGEGTGAVVEPQLEANYGTLRSYYYKDNGEKATINSSAGTINYVTGLVSLNSIKTAGPVENPFYANDELTVFIPAASEILTPIRNNILSIDDADAKSIQITMVAET